LAVLGQSRIVQLDLDFWIEECFFTALGEAARADGLRHTASHLEAAWSRIEAAEATTLIALKRVGTAVAPPARDDAEEPDTTTSAGGGRRGKGRKPRGGRGGRGGRDGGRGGSGANATEGSGSGGGRGSGANTTTPGRTQIRSLPAAERDALRSTLASKDPSSITKVDALRADLCFRCKHPRHGRTTPPCAPRGVILDHGPVFE
jgi:hypothetical protein